MKTILIPIDFTSTSSKALEIGATIAKRISAKIVLTHMAGIEERLLTKTNTLEETVYHTKLAEKKYSELLEQPFLNDILVEPLLQKKLDFTSINNFAQEINASLIVMGSRGSSGLKEIFKGSNAEKVVRSSETPVLIIKENDLIFAPKRLIFASNFDEEAISAYYKIIEIATLLSVKIELLYVNLPNDQFISTKKMDEKLLGFFNKVNHPNPVNAIKTVNRVADYTVEQGVFNFASLSGVDIIAIPTHGRKGLSHFFNGSISEDIVNHSSLPVLTVKMQ
ncbi:universal stress protein [Patiriisocius hiemis]|uniref:Universal stress protein n=1 Tax=Patiriisocius hiemis TaxID=3075604 RepID=A0ABU2YDU7_9FLAO|nr:universal stress protein [Constantimarinum sp. W242]MDT0555932.1 universal stress protein [Constantimarinum sp. W242]